MIEAINKLVRDPAWWVTTVFAGIVVSIIAKILWQVFAKALARYFPTFREWRQKRRAVFLRNAEDVASDMVLILDTTIRAVAMLVIWSGSLTIMMGFYILIKAMNTHSNMLIAMVFLFGIVSFFPYFMAIHLFRLSREARRIYKKRKFS